jgi:hypothetical protein
LRMAVVECEQYDDRESKGCRANHLIDVF